jgi:serine O-acetyltransferase
MKSMFDNVRIDLRLARASRNLKLDPSQVKGSWKDLTALFQVGTLAVVSYRFAHWVLRLRVPVVRQLLSIVAALFQHFTNLISGTCIAPDAEIGPGLVVHTPYAIHVGATRIGANCTVQTGVLIAAGSRGIGDNVYFGAGAKVIADTKIGNNVVVVANSLVLTDVPDHTTIVGVPARIRLPGGRPRKVPRLVATVEN